jgi:hypothetical protein
MVRFDGYSATTTAAGYMDLLSLLLKDTQSDRVEIEQGRGFHTFKERLSVRKWGHEIGSVSWGGEVQGQRCMLEVKGEDTPEVVEGLRRAFPHRCTRVDSCADFDAPGVFEQLVEVCTQVKRRHRLRGSKAGDWEDHPEDGRTLYVGAVSSVARIRLYEKGKQVEYSHLGMPDWTRLELQIRPAKEAKEGYAKLDAMEVWGASAWTRELAAEVLRNHVHPHPAGTVYRQSSLDRRTTFMCAQYGATLIELLSALGDWECVGRTIQDEIARQRMKGHH